MTPPNHRLRRVGPRPILRAALAALAFVPAGARAQDRPITAPSGRIVAQVEVSSPDHGPAIAIRLDDRELARVDGLGFEFVDAPGFGRDLQIVGRRSAAATLRDERGLGKRRALLDRHRETVWTLQERGPPGRTAALRVRAHDDGVEYRWELVAWPGVTAARIVAEHATLSVAGDPRAFPLYRDGFRSSHEGPYTQTRLAALEPARLIDLPLLFARDDGACIAFTEADVRDYPHAYLERASGQPARLSLRLSPRIDQPDITAEVTLPCRTPWRVLMIGDTIARLLESDLLLQLCERSAIADPSWIRPGKQTWHWWNGTVLDAEHGGGMDHATMRAYVDFCADAGVAFHAVTGQDVPWYVQTRRSVLPGPDADCLTPRPELEWDRLREHAARRGVGLRLWVHWQVLAPHVEDAFALYESWGVSGVMVDFLDRDDQQMVRFCEQVLEAAARHQLTIQFHGSFKPTGLQRTWPNLMNHEGSANLEVLKWADGCDPEHDLVVPFTRGLAGPLDYHLGGFRAARRDEFEPHYLRPSVFGTRARALAMYVVLENPLPMVCDFPAAYVDQPGFDFVVDVPTVWDESRVLSAEIGDHLVWARRSGTRWYVGAITDWTPRDLALPLTFLGPGEHELTLLADPAEPDAPPDLLVESRRAVTAGDVLELHLAAGGGAAAVIEVHPR